MRKIYLTEEQVREFVRQEIITEHAYINKLNKDKRVADITYNNLSRKVGNVGGQDYLTTDKMEKNDGDTYEIKLKGGITCYNITSIKGDKVMHYFKHKWADNRDAEITVKDAETKEKNTYKLQMAKAEEDTFINKFKQKVAYVIKYCVNNFKRVNKDYNFSMISIYPVPSSSNFNDKMAGILAKSGLYGIPCQVIDGNILKKDFDKIEKDNEFIEKNKEFYNQPFFASDNNNNKTVEQNLDVTLEKLAAKKRAQALIDEANKYVQKLFIQIYNYRQVTKDTSVDRKRMIASIVNNFTKYYDTTEKIRKASTYYDYISGEHHKQNDDSLFQRLKYSKGPSIEKRSKDVWAIVKPYLRGCKCEITGEPYSYVELVLYTKNTFQIKNISAGERMGLKNMYTPNEEYEKFKGEIERIKGTVFVIFDDNVSGGATLGDICMQFKNLGIDNMIPITFGDMSEKWTENRIPLTNPGLENNKHARWNF